MEASAVGLAAAAGRLKFRAPLRSFLLGPRTGFSRTGDSVPPNLARLQTHLGCLGVANPQPATLNPAGRARKEAAGDGALWATASRFGHCPLKSIRGDRRSKGQITTLQTPRSYSPAPREVKVQAEEGAAAAGPTYLQPPGRTGTFRDAAALTLLNTSRSSSSPSRSSTSAGSRAEGLSPPPSPAERPAERSGAAGSSPSIPTVRARRPSPPPAAAALQAPERAHWLPRSPASRPAPAPRPPRRRGTVARLVPPGPGPGEAQTPRGRGEGRSPPRAAACGRPGTDAAPAAQRGLPRARTWGVPGWRPVHSADPRRGWKAADLSVPPREKADTVFPVF